MTGQIAIFRVVLACFAATFFGDVQGNELLKSPEPIAQQEVLASYQDVTGQFGPDSRWFQYDHGAVSLSVRYRDALPKTLSEEERKLFVSSYEVVEGRPVIVYSYDYGVAPGAERPIPVSYAHAGRMFSKGNRSSPTRISVDTCAQLIQEKRCVFFTGAGISAAAGVHTIKALWRDLGIDPEVEVDQFVLHALHQPEILVTKILQFYQLARDAQPTTAHYSLARLAKAKQCQIISGNFDRLQERTGIRPFRVSYEDWREKVEEEWLKDIELIVCMGMSHDIDALLEAYKAHNPDGLIIAIDQEQPSFLGPEDFFLHGDVQYLLPAVAAGSAAGSGLTL